jgi:hypothetical protein
MHFIYLTTDTSMLTRNIQLLRACDKENLMKRWESFYMQTLQQLDLLIDEQQTHKLNPLYPLGDVTKQVCAYSVSTRQSQ